MTQSRSHSRSRIIPTKGYFRPHPKSTPGLAVGNLLFLAGHVARDANGDPVGVGDVVAQFHQALHNVRLVLNAAGGDLDDIVKMTMYLTDLSELDEVLRARREYFSSVPPSASIGVSALSKADYLIEIDAIAVLDAGRPRP
jgi:2-iminobutanoate/2-iminopropanoate deaminase